MSLTHKNKLYTTTKHSIQSINRQWHSVWNSLILPSCSVRSDSLPVADNLIAKDETCMNIALMQFYIPCGFPSHISYFQVSEMQPILLNMTIMMHVGAYMKYIHHKITCRNSKGDCRIIANAFISSAHHFLRLRSMCLIYLLDGYEKAISLYSVNQYYSTPHLWVRKKIVIFNWQKQIQFHHNQ